MGGVIKMSHKELTRLEIMQKLDSRLMKQSQAADTLGLSIRQIKRLLKTYRVRGAESLISKKRGAKSNHRLPDEVKKQTLELILDKYSDFGPTLVQEKLAHTHGLKISVGSVRNLMISTGLWEPKRAKKKANIPDERTTS